MTHISKWFADYNAAFEQFVTIHRNWTYPLSADRFGKFTITPSRRAVKDNSPGDTYDRSAPFQSVYLTMTFENAAQEKILFDNLTPDELRRVADLREKFDMWIAGVVDEPPSERTVNVWIITTDGQRSVDEIAIELVALGLRESNVLEAINVVTGSADANVVAKLRTVRGVVDVSPETTVDIGPPGTDER